MTSLQPQLLHPRARLQWTRCADIPVEMNKGRAVVMGEKVYVGGGDTEEDEDKYYVFQYNTSQDEWSRLPTHHVIIFAMAHFIGNLITVGGEGAGGVGITGKLYRFKEESQEWEEFLSPPSLPLGGLLVSGVVWTYPVPLWRCTAVKHLSSTLPTPCLHLTMGCLLSPSLAPAIYLLGGGDANNNDVTTVLYASLTSLIQKAISPTHQSASQTSVWKTLPDTPLKNSTAASLSGNLLKPAVPHLTFLSPSPTPDHDGRPTGATPFLQCSTAVVQHHDGH